LQHEALGRDAEDPSFCSDSGSGLHRVWTTAILSFRISLQQVAHGEESNWLDRHHIR
jgi:hypothetical protein